MKLDILYEDDQYVFVNKPSGLLAIPDRHHVELPSVQSLLSKEYEQLFMVHRLDRDTSGCICMAKTSEVHRYTSLLFEHREVEKYYSAIVRGTPSAKEGSLQEPIMEHPTLKGKMVVNVKNGKPSRTDYTLEEGFGLFSLLKYRLYTGRTHQIRVHSSYMGHPIVCDELYGDGNPVYLSSFKKKFKLSKDAEEENPILNRLALHAAELRFINIDKQAITVSAPLPRDLNAMLKQCRKWL
jgi:23S rRNA pseudouridine1911/1915/1917 synthase